MNKKVSIIIGILIVVIIFIAGCHNPFKNSKGGHSKDTNNLVTTCGSKFCLNGEEFKFIGVNLAWLLEVSHTEMDSIFEEVSGLGIKVIRVYLDNGKGLDSLKKRTSNIDYMLALAEKYNIRIVMTLSWWGGMPQSYGMDFFSDKEAQKEYKEWAEFVVGRYKDNPYVFSWELINEPEYFHLHFKGELNFGDLLNWIEMMSAYIKSLDNKHMVSVGTGGAWQYYAGLKPYDTNYYILMHQSDNIDFTTIHFYGFKRLNEDEDKIEEILKNMIMDGHKLGKPVILEEFGLKRSWGVDKEFWFNFMLDMFFANGGDGAMYWQSRLGTDWQEEYGISSNPEDDTLRTIIREKEEELIGAHEQEPPEEHEMVIGINYRCCCFFRPAGIMLWKDEAWNDPRVQNQIKQDLDNIQKLGFKVVRIFFGRSYMLDSDNTVQDKYEERLDEFLSMLSERGMKAHLVLLSNADGIGPNFKKTKLFLTDLMRKTTSKDKYGIAEDERIYMVELVNEYSRFFSTEDEKAKNIWKDWLRKTWDLLLTLDKKHLKNGVSIYTRDIYHFTTQSFSDLKSIYTVQPDYYDVHHYSIEGPGGKADWQYLFRTLIPYILGLVDIPQSKLGIGEFGLYTCPPNTSCRYHYSYMQQREYISNIIRSAKKENIPYIYVWQYNDYLQASDHQDFYGIYDCKGNLKPSAEILEKLNKNKKYNLIGNPGVEYFHENWKEEKYPDGWLPLGNATFRVDTFSYRGNYSLRISDGEGAWVYKPFEIAVDPCKKYLFSAYMLAKDTENAFIGIRWFDSNGNFIKDTLSHKAISQNQWQLIEMEAIPPKNAFSLIPFAMLNSSEGTVWFDNFNLEEKSRGLD